MNRVLEDKRELLKKKEVIQTHQDMNLNESCTLMENIEVDGKREHLEKKYGHYNIYESSIDGKTKSYKVNHLIENFYETLSFSQKKNAKVLTEKLAKNAIAEIIEKQYDYFGILKLNSVSRKIKNLNSCLKSDVNLKELSYRSDLSQNIENLELYKKFLINNLINAFQAKIFFSFLKDIDHQEKVAETEFYKTHKRDARGRFSKEEELKLEKLEEKFSNKKQIALLPLGEMIKSSPLLFSYTNNFSMVDWVNNEIVESEFLESLIQGFSKNLLLEMKEKFEKYPNLISLESIILDPKNQFYFDNFINEKLENHKLKKTVQKSIENYINTLNRGAQEICEKQGDGLHHNENLVKFVLDNNVHSDNFTNIMTRDHAGYCYLKANSPKEDIGKFTWKTGVGLTFIGLGIGAQAFLGLGTTAGLVAIGAGGALITGETAYNSYISYEQELQEQALQFSGWSNHRIVIENMNQTNDLISDLGTDAVMTVVGAGAGKLITHYQKMNKLAEDDLLNTSDKVDMSSYNRGSLNASLLEDGSDQSLAVYKQLIWKRHDLMWKDYIKSPSRYRLLSKREKFRARNRNDLPAYHIYGDSGEETLSILEVVKKGDLESEDGVKALEKVQKWIDEYESYPSEINIAVDKGYEAKKQLPELELALKKYSPKDFFDGNEVFVPLTKVIDGKTVENVNESFQSYYDLDKYVKKQRQISQSTFARNSLEELTKQSDLYRIMDQQAVDYRRLEYLRDYLKRVDSRNEVQEKLLIQAKNLLAKDELRPRADAIKRLQKKELKAERADFFRSMKKKETLLNNMDIKLTDVAANKVKETGFVGNYFKTMIYVGLTGGLTGIGSGAVARYLHTGGSLDEISSSFELAWVDLSRKVNQGYTTDEMNCASQGRHFSYMLCFTNLAKKELGVERARAIIKSDEYSFRTDPKVTKKLYEFAYRMQKLRKKLRGPELFILANSILDNSYEYHSVREIVELIEKISDDHELGHLVASILTSNDKNKIRTHLEELEKNKSGDYIEAIKLIVADKNAVVKSIKNSARLPVEIEMMIRGMDYEESEYNISDDNFFDLTREMIEQAEEVIE